MKTLLSFVLVLAGLAASQDRAPLVAVMPLQTRGVDSNATRILEDAIADGLVGTGEMRLMERAQMNQVLAEQGFQESGTCDQSECAVQVGKLLGVERAVVGSVGLLGKTYVINTRVVDIGSGEVLRSSQQRLTGEIDQVLSDLVPKVVADLTRKGNAANVPVAKTTPTPAPAVEESSSGWIWWTLGGVAVAGGAAAAALVLMGGGGEAATPAPTPDPGPSTTDGTLIIELPATQP